MILNAKSRYAVMALTDLARREGTVKLAELSARQEIPLPYLEQLFARLRKEGLVDSVRGPGGGYRLARPAATISVAEIVRAVDESLKMTRCEKNSHEGCLASRERCLTHDLWEGLTQQIEGYLSGIHLSDVAEKKIPFQSVA